MSDWKPTVQCVGGGAWDKAIRNEFGRRIRYAPTSDPCGWKGRRQVHPIPGRKGSWGSPTVKPCPLCGGKVELIQRQGTV